MATSNNKEAEFYQNTLRVLLILYFFSDEFFSEENPNLVKQFHNETRIQKIDFLIRYPSYLCDELMNLADKDRGLKPELGSIIVKILNNDEPKFKTKEMQKFFFGAYGRLNEVIAFLKAYGFLDYHSRRRTDFREHQKEYYLTTYAIEKIENGLAQIPLLQWYFERCALIQKYFGDLSGTQLKDMQYEHPEYRDEAWGKKIKDIETRVRQRFSENYKAVQ